MCFVSTSKLRTRTNINTSSCCCNPSHWLHIWYLPTYLAAYHACPVEARGLTPPPVVPVSRPQPHASLCSTGVGWARRRAPHAVFPVVVVSWLRPYCLLHWHDIQTAPFYLPDGLSQSVAPAIPDVDFPDGGQGWAWVPAARRRRRCVQATGSLGGRPVEGDWNPCQGEKIRNKKEKDRTGYFRIYSRFFITPLSRNGRG